MKLFDLSHDMKRECVMILRGAIIGGKAKKKVYMNKTQIQAFDNRHIRTSAWKAQLTLQGIGDMLNLSKERVRKIETKFLINFRKVFQADGTKLSDLI